MFSSILLVCIVGTTDCSVQSSSVLFDTLQQCEETSQTLQKRVNENEESLLFVVDTACVGWGTKA